MNNLSNSGNNASALLLKQVSNLLVSKNNARTHSDAQIQEIKKSIEKFGWTNPILVKNNTIIAGHGRVRAAKLLKLEHVPAVDLSRFSETDAQAYVIADNQLALNAGWDLGILKSEINDLSDVGFDISVLGFSDSELDELLAEEPLSIDDDAADDAPPLSNEPPRTKEGDIWILGEHRLMCGNSTSIEHVDKLLNGQSVELVYTDPPYGIDIVKKDGRVGGNSAVYDKIIGDDSIQTAVDAYNLCAAMSVPVLILWGGNYYSSHLPDSPGWIIWDKKNGGTDFADCELAWTNTKGAARIFSHQWSGYLKDSERGEKRCHPTQKPVALAEWCIETYAPKSTTVLDLFGGSGSTLIACEKLRKRSFLMELSPAYCDVIIERWEKISGREAELEGGEDG